jgi:hypothetical protein
MSIYTCENGTCFTRDKNVAEKKLVKTVAEIIIVYSTSLGIERAVYVDA